MLSATVGPSPLLAELGVGERPTLEQIPALGAGLHPETHEQLVGTRTDGIRVAYWDVVYSVPKSVSVEFAAAAAAHDTRRCTELLEDVQGAATTGMSTFAELLPLARRGARGAQPMSATPVCLFNLHSAARPVKGQEAPDPHLHVHMRVLNLAYFRRRLDGALHTELQRPGAGALSDPLTGLRNHRAFHEDLTRSLHRAGRIAVPISLVMLDLDKLKEVNDTLGHQAGDDRLKALANAIRSTQRGTDCAYRVGGDEFAVILDGTRAWNALEFTQRLHALLATGPQGVYVTASAGISERLEFADKDRLIREADLALIAAKRSGQRAVIYTPELELRAASADPGHDHHTRTLANALAALSSSSGV